VKLIAFFKCGDYSWTSDQDNPLTCEDCIAIHRDEYRVLIAEEFTSAIKDAHIRYGEKLKEMNNK